MDLRVDMDGLDRFAHALDRSLTSLAEARRALDHIRSDQLGSAELDAACDAFQQHWAHGADRLRDRIGALNDGVRLSHRAHAQLDQAIEAAFRAVPPRA
ncbi:hypothetical protein [Streptomyces sp. NPDC020965]|uniref:hypothetical protein n=1 Tax=Streptomyces sp. NPDC020965 TaxID=3365105 RepID=UPI0037B00BD1